MTPETFEGVPKWFVANAAVALAADFCYEVISKYLQKSFLFIENDILITLAKGTGIT
jgi:hypothetical protein